MNIQDKVIVITGSGQGLGRSMAIYLASFGVKLALIDLHQDLLKETVKLIEKQGSKAKYYVTDVTNELDVEKTFSEINQDFDGFDGLINNAGILNDGMFVKVKEGKVTKKMSLQQFQSVIDVNLTGVFLCGREATVHMINRNRKGVIINMSSIVRTGNIGQTNYAASKAGVVAMTVTWARELSKHGIRVGAIAPGIIQTSMTENMKPEMLERSIKMIPLGRLGKADEIAHSAKYILENEFFTGRTIEIDGGLFG